jgi:hypothetical protein
MRKLLISLGLVLLVVTPALAAGPVAGPQDCVLEWIVPTTNTDNSPLTDLASWQVFISPTAGTFTTVTATITVASPTPIAGTHVTYNCAPGLSDGQKWATVRAVDLAGNFSANATPDASMTGGTQANGIPFVFDAVSPKPATGLLVR